MLTTPRPTAFDIEFRLLGIPVRVIPWFWLIAAILGFETLKISPWHMLIWMGIVFVSILVHEFGHALTARAFGYPPIVVLHGFGGLAMYHPDQDYRPWKSLVISLAGPGAGFILGGMIFAVFIGLNLGQVALSDLGNFAITQLLFVNIAWGLINLLPVLPLDGGRVCEALCTMAGAREPTVISLYIGAAVGGLVAVAAFSLSQTYIGFLFAMLAFQSISALQYARRR